jgi:hypothetical protein
VQRRQAIIFRLRGVVRCGGQSVHCYQGKLARRRTCIGAGKNFCSLMEPHFLIRAQRALGAIYEHRGGQRFLENQF